RAEAGMVAMAKHTATASVGIGEHAEIAIVSVGTLVHERTPSSCGVATSRSRTELAVAVRKALRGAGGRRWEWRGGRAAGALGLLGILYHRFTGGQLWVGVDSR